MRQALKAALAAGVLTRDQVAECLELQRQARSRGEDRGLEEFLIEEGHLTEERLGTLRRICEEAGDTKRLEAAETILGDRNRMVARLFSRKDLAEESALSRIGRYELIRSLGKGGMGEVWLAWDAGIRREVAVKVLRTGIGSEPLARRFQREIQLLGSIRHPGVVEIHDAGYDEGRLYYVMPVVPQGSFQPGALGLRDSVSILVDVARACHACHEQGVVHRDLKPSNILMGDRPRVSDFGLAKIVESSERLTQTGLIVGTPHYMSPEQATGQDVDARADVYSLGAILYEILTGTIPFAGKDVFEMLGRIATATPIPPRQIRPDTPRALEATALRAIAKRPQDRHPSAAAFAAELEGWLARDLSGAGSYWARLFGSWRRPALTIGGAGAVALGIVLAVLGIAAPDPGGESTRQDGESSSEQLFAKARETWACRLRVGLSDPRSDAALSEIDREIAETLSRSLELRYSDPAQESLARALLEWTTDPSRGEARLAELAISPSGDPEAAIFLAESRLVLGQIEAALLDARRALGLSPNGRTGVALALALGLDGSMALAFDELARALAPGPQAEAASRFLPLLLQWSLEREPGGGADESFARLLERTRALAAANPDSPEILVARGAALVVEGARRIDRLESADSILAEARFALERALKLGPARFETSWWLAMAHAQSAIYRAWVLKEDVSGDLARLDVALAGARMLAQDHPFLQWWDREGVRSIEKLIELSE